MGRRYDDEEIADRRSRVWWQVLTAPSRATSARPVQGVSRSVVVDEVTSPSTGLLRPVLGGVEWASSRPGPVTLPLSSQLSPAGRRPSSPLFIDSRQSRRLDLDHPGSPSGL